VKAIGASELIVLSKSNIQIVVGAKAEIIAEEMKSRL